MATNNTERQKWFEVTRRTALFEGLPDADLRALLDSAQERSLVEGEFFFMQGDPATRSFVLVQGKVRLSQVNPDGQQVIQGYIGPGREFGIIAAVGASHYPVSAQAAGRSVALGWDQMVFKRMIAENPQVAQNALQIMARQIAEFQTRVRELSTQRVERRVARALLRLAQQSGRKTEAGVLIDLPLSRQDLAELTGTTLFTVSRILKGWETRGLVRSQRERVTITSPHGLVTIAEDLDGEE